MSLFGKGGLIGAPHIPESRIPIIITGCKDRIMKVVKTNILNLYLMKGEITHRINTSIHSLMDHIPY